MTTKELQEEEWVTLTDRWNDLAVEADKLADPAVKERFRSLVRVIGELLRSHGERDAVLVELARAEAAVEGARDALRDIIKEQRTNETYLLEQLRAARAAAAAKGKGA